MNPGKPAQYADLGQDFLVFMDFLFVSAPVTLWIQSLVTQIVFYGSMVKVGLL